MAELTHPPTDTITKVFMIAFSKFLNLGKGGVTSGKNLPISSTAANFLLRAETALTIIVRDAAVENDEDAHFHSHQNHLMH